MTVCSETVENVMDSSSNGNSPSSSYEREVREHCRLRLGMDSMSFLMAFGHSITRTDSEEDVSYRKMRESLTILLKRLPTHGEIVCWLEKCYRGHTHIFHYLFRRDNTILMAENMEASHLEIDYSWVRNDILCEESCYVSKENNIFLLEQNVFNNATLSSDDNKVLKMPIYSSVQDHRQNFKCL